MSAKLLKTLETEYQDADWTDEQVYRFWERVGMLIGDEPMTLEAFEAAKREVEER